MNELDRTRKMLAEVEGYEGPDQLGALLGEIDARIELMILGEMNAWTAEEAN